MMSAEQIQPANTPQQDVIGLSQIPDAVKAQAETIKDAANKLFQTGKFKEACDKYSEAIALNPFVPAYFGNRAFSHLKLESYGYAIRDADEALKLDPSFVKAYYRRASAKMALFKIKEAIKDLRMVVKYVPNDRDAREKLTEAEKIAKKIEFERALAYDDSAPPLTQTVKYEDMTVEDSYDGLRWETEELSVDWILDMMDRFKQQKRIHRKYALKILLLVSKILRSLPSVVDVQIPKSPDAILTICGDVHGQFYDFVNIFAQNGYPSETHAYLFNGDFVDRGSFSAEVIFTLFAFKLKFPTTFFMSRGNHETDNMNKVYGFEGEIRQKYTETTFKLFSEIFNHVPLGNVVENRLFVVHGGLFSRDDVSIAELRKIDRFKQPPGEGLMCEMMWSDPMAANGRTVSKRGIGLQFGPDVTAAFCKYNNLDMVIRSHEVKDDGYVIEHDGKCVTVFSAPNYCDMVGNKGAYINVTRKNPSDLSSERPELNLSYTSFSAVPHPPVKAMQYSGNYGGMFNM